MELGITGHLTRNDEVVKILEMLGGKNQYKIIGGLENHFYYIGDKDKYINNSYIGSDEIKGYEIFSLEGFLEKFPYKVGDKVEFWSEVDYYGRTELETSEIISMRWNSARCEIAYRLKGECKEFYKSDIKGKVKENLFDATDEYEEIVDKAFQGGYQQCKLDIQSNGYELPDGHHFTDENENVIDATKILIKKNSPTYPKTNNDEEPQIDTSIDYSAEILKSMEEETGKRLAEITMNTVVTTAITHEYLEERGFTLPDGYHFADRSGNVIDATEILLVKNQPYYPKTYEECCDILKTTHVEWFGYYGEVLVPFQILIICRDAYWKIAGEHMGLDEPWKPDFSDDSPKYNIFNYENEITLSDNNWSNRILAFPTLEMRNAFHENFKDLIENCKELL